MCKCTPEIRTPYCGKPGCEWPGTRSVQDDETAKALGYTLTAYGGNGDFASFSHPDDAITLDLVSKNGKISATLSATYKMVQLTVGPISWPHPLFETFQRQLRFIMGAIG